MRLPKPASAVLFDFDHTLYDSDQSLSMAYLDAARAGGLAEPEAHRADFERINDALWRRVEAGEVSPNEVRFRRFKELLAHIGREDGVESTAADMADAFVAGLIAHGELLPGASRLLDAVADRPIALVTNGIGAVQRGRLDRLGLADAFDVVSISGELGVAKPSAAIFDHTFAGFSSTAEVDRESAVMIGDSWGSDVAGAMAAGLAAIWFNADGRPPGDVTADVAVVEVGRLDHIAPLLG